MPTMKPARICILRAVRQRLAQLRAVGVRRVEAKTLCGFVAGERWVRMLGFQPEGIAGAYGPSGQNFMRWGLTWPQ